ncbi:MAG: aminotransferase class V-fold PLP-dependent enzyme [Christensenellaceae bacterium]|jgi:cysteine desulfurase|nr:aminotransferase class V-fold PLP-dependent enzyme [Christensenellaceae bacterium]
MIYLDNAATTKIAQTVFQKIKETEETLYLNANANYSVKIQNEIESAAKIILRKLDGSKGHLIFTSGATESNKLIIEHFFDKQGSGNRLAIIGDEHASIYEVAKGLGYTTVPDKNTRLFCFGLINSDTGTMIDAKEIIKKVRQAAPQCHIHCDATQAFCKYDFSVNELDFDSCTVSAHKINGPKGVGALWTKKNNIFRLGTPNNGGIIGFASAVENFDTKKNLEKINKLHDYLIENLPEGCNVNGNNNNPYITNISLPNIMGETMLNALASKQIYVGTGSACSSNANGNRSLALLGLSKKQQKQVIRISFGKDNTMDEVKEFLQILTDKITQLSQR